MTARTIRPYGDRALLLDCRDPEEALALHTELAGQPWVAEAIPGARTLLVRLHEPPTPEQRARLAGAPATPEAPEPGRLVEVEVIYDGPDLHLVADTLRLSPAAVVAQHTGTEWQVAFCGFVPGFAYLHDPRGRHPRVPRRTESRTVVPAGSVAIAAQWSGIYPRQAAGAWNVIGRSATPIWTPALDQPTVLGPGDRVRFIATTESASTGSPLVRMSDPGGRPTDRAGRDAPASDAFIGRVP
ncbi:5-oxoprolinase subunit B family protein [Propionibacteriaceae bacterium Y2011]